MQKNDNQHPDKRAKTGISGLFKTKSDRLAAIGVVAVILAVLVIWISGMRSNRPDDSDKAMTLTSTQKESVDKTAKTFLNTAGNFGFDWENVSEKGEEPGKLDAKDVSSNWLKHSADPQGKAIEDDYAAHITPRDVALTALLHPYDSEVPPMSSSNSMNRQNLEYAPLSDAIYLSRFSIDPGTVKINWKGANIKRNSDTLMSVTVKVSWDTQWKRATQIPLDNDTGTRIIPLSEWAVETTRQEFQDVRMTLTSTDGGKNWQVSGIKDGGNNDWSKYNWMLAVGEDFKYDATGKILNVPQDDMNGKED